MLQLKGQGKLDEFAFVLLAGLVIIIVMLLVWGVPGPTEIPTVNPTSKTLSIERGKADDFILEINVSSKQVTLTARGTIKDWVSFSNNNFDSYGLSNVEVTVKVPSGADEGTHFGTIVVESQEGGESIVDLTIKVKEPKEETTEEASRNIYIGDFTVSYAEGTETVGTESDIEVKNGGETISASITRDMDLVTEGSLILDVLYTNNEGNLVVKFNNKVVYDDKAMPGEITIPLTKDLLDSYNIIEISTSKPWWKFWTSSIYRIEIFEFNIDYFGDIEKRESFEVYRDELLNFREAWVYFYINSYDGPGHLKVEINGYTLYEGRYRGSIERSFDFADVGLTRGTNTITFSTEKGTSYEIEDARITIVHEMPD